MSKKPFGFLFSVTLKKYWSENFDDNYAQDFQKAAPFRFLSVFQLSMNFLF